ncbi:class I SAM-dependent methyltransferase [Virgisporangium aurantiacum]|uniref:Methyltransferase n=1 Tax=Virgisporangium aurantiacum TaxID=175570 RepID=A0A8J4E248_9ACTN|nr:class I SAM-dependent methyltransferase [Virgisporangium aurantiacum]GIJ59440.1 methyltransferase [Virgisporangium aurantiacum]
MTAQLHPGTPGYSFDNDDPEAVDRHVYLSTIMDPYTFDRLSTVGDLTGRRCLEVGAGGGSVARWLADQVGPTGHVLATDLKPEHLDDGSGYTVLQHDLVTEPVPAGEWDLIHARMVLLHIPEREEILARLAAALAPGGALVVEDWASEFTGGILLNAPSPEAGDLFDDYQDTLFRIIPRRGNDPTWAGRVHSLMLRAGLTDVETGVHARSWRGGEAGALLILANVGQLRQEFIEEGFGEDRMAQLRTLVTDPQFVIRGHFMYANIGRKPV